MKEKTIEIVVGLFIMLAIVCLFVLAMRVSGFTETNKKVTYQLSAEFDNIGGLKEGAPVVISGVKIGEIHSINLDPQTYRAVVYMNIYSQHTFIPVDSSASIFTMGILGAQYISISPGYSSQNLGNNGVIQSTHSALILENLIGQLVFNMTKK